MKREETIKRAITRYIRLRYPKIIYRWDVGADVKMSIGQAKKSKMIHAHDRGFPDLIVFFPKNGRCGLFIELKAEGVRLKTRTGKWATPHIREQAEMHERLRELGYEGGFAVGFDEAVKMIDDYML